MKNIDLHLHLDGSLRIKTVLDLANKSNILVPQDEFLLSKMLKVSDNDIDLVDYLSKFGLPIKLMQDEESLYRVGFELIEDLASENHIYAEIRFAPQLHTKMGMNCNDVISFVNQGMQAASNQYKMPYGLIICAMRHNSVNDAKNIIDVANKNIINNVVGVDLAGDEFNFPAINFKDAFSRSDLPITIHAGEARGSDSVRDAISMGAKRIGHGVRSIEDLNVIGDIVKNDIILEICPTSNQDTKMYNIKEEYPIKELINHGVKIALCTDNRTVSNTNLENERDFLKKTFNLSQNDFHNFTKNSAEGMFSSNSIKKSILKQIDKNKIIKKKY